jgi:hypothetical protein
MMNARLIAGLLLAAFGLAECLSAQDKASGGSLVGQFVESRCERPFAEVTPSPDTKSTIRGSLPAPLVDDSSWAKVDVAYEPLDEAVEGHSALRVKVNSVESGRVQLAIRGLPLSSSADVKISLSVRSPGGTPIRVELRQHGPPYRGYWSRAVATAAEWSRVDLIAPAVSDDPNAMFIIGIEQSGTVDLDDLRIEYVKSEVAVDVDRVPNLLPSGSFPDGLSAPWVGNGRPRAETDPTVIGPTGAAALKLTFERRPGDPPFINQVRAPFRAVPGRAYTLSLFVKSEKPGQVVALRFGPPNEKLWTDPWQKTVTLNDAGFARVSHTVVLPPTPDSLYMVAASFDGSGVVWIDGMQVRVGETPGDFERTMPVELAATPVAFEGLVFEGQPWEVRLSSVGRAVEGATVRGMLTDLAGQSVEVFRRPLPAGGLQRVTQTIDPGDRLQPLGSYRLEVQALSADGTAISQVAELLLHRVREPRFLGEFRPDSAFGIHYRTGPVDEDGARLSKALGFNWLRLFNVFAWHVIEPKKGEYRFEAADRVVENLKRNHLMALGIVGEGAPAWASNNPTGYKGWARFVPNDMNAWSEFCQAVLQRYGGVVRDMEAWNEPYLPHFFTREVTEDGKRIGGTVEEYLAVHRAAFEAAERVKPHPPRIIWNTNALTHPERSRECIDGGVLEMSPIITLHQYTPSLNIERELRSHVDAIRAMLPESRKNTPLWLSEGGAGLAAIFNFYRHVPPTRSLEETRFWANWQCRYYLGCLLAGMDKVFIYLIDDQPKFIPDYSICNVDGRIGPNLTALSNLAWHIDGLKHHRTIEPGGGAVVHVFSNGQRSVAITRGISATSACDKAATVQAKVADVFGNDLTRDSRFVFPGELLFLRLDGPPEPLERLFTAEQK